MTLLDTASELRVEVASKVLFDLISVELMDLMAATVNQCRIDLSLTLQSVFPMACQPINQSSSYNFN